MNKKFNNNINATAKMIQDREYIMQVSMLTAMEVLKDDMKFNDYQIQMFAEKYIDRLKGKMKG